MSKYEIAAFLIDADVKVQGRLFPCSTTDKAEAALNVASELLHLVKVCYS